MPVVALALVLVFHFAPPVEVRLADGRVLLVLSRRRKGDHVRLETAFGELLVPAGALAKGHTAARAPAGPVPPPRRTTRSRWIELEHDLSPERERLYADQLDAFVDLMIRVYELDEQRMKREAPFRVEVYRRRRDFKKVQAEVAPGIEESKGKGFAEGVAGFYSGGHDVIFMWDAEGAHGGVHLEVAKHEATHMLNKRFASRAAIRLPVWFEEGTATYFSMSMPVGDGALAEPEAHAGALALVVGEIRQERAMTSRELRATGFAAFMSRQYSWGWGLIHFFRNHAGGKRWRGLLEYMRTLSSAGGVTDSEERRYLKSSGFRTSPQFDRAWNDHLAGIEGVGGRAPVGTAPEVLKRIEAVEQPPPAVARNFARVGSSLARARLFAPAIVYLRAALRGGVEDPHLPYELAVSLAGQQGIAEDAVWPDEAVEALELAVRRAPLRALYRMRHGLQLLARAGDEAALRRARAALGLALLLAGPDDDDVELALALIRAGVALEPERDPERIVAGLEYLLPRAAEALHTALVYMLQEREEWGKLAGIVRRRMERGEATFEERVMLAGLLKVSDELDEALALYRALLEEQPDALGLWPEIVVCLYDLDRVAEARSALAAARDSLDRDSRDWGFVRRRLDRLERR